MFYEKLATDRFVLRLVRGEKVIPSLEEFCQHEQIEGGFFYGIGAVDQAELAHYNVDTQKYSSKKFDQALEVTNLTGTIALDREGLVIHAHGTFSDTEMHCLGGHVVELRVSGTLELILHTTTTLSKSIDTETGLKLLDLPHQL